MSEQTYKNAPRAYIDYSHSTEDSREQNAFGRFIFDHARGIAAVFAAGKRHDPTPPHSHTPATNPAIYARRVECHPTFTTFRLGTSTRLT